MSKRKSLTEFIRENRAELIAAIRNVVPQAPNTTTEIRLWILNDEGLYNWAKSEGVKGI